MADVDKALRIPFRRAKKAVGPIIRSGVTRAGRVGIEMEHEGVKGWGVNESAARASLQQNKAARNGVAVGKRDKVEKGVIRQGVAPTLARVAPAAATAARPALVAKPKAIIGKGAVGETLRTARLLPKAAEAGWKSGTKSGKARASLGDTVRMNSSKTLQRVGGASKWAAENRGAAGLSTGVVSGSVLGAGLARRDDVGKGYPYPRLKGKFGDAMRSAHERAEQAKQAGKSTFGADIVSGRESGRAARRARQDGRSKDEAKQLAEHRSKRELKRYLNGERDVRKAHGDPEDARYYRLGIGSAALGAGGAAGLGYAGREAKYATRVSRKGAKQGAWAGKVQLAHRIKGASVLDEKLDPKIKDILRSHEREVQAAARVKRGGFAITRRGALAGAGGLAALGGAEKLRRLAHERRYN